MTEHDELPRIDAKVVQAFGLLMIGLLIGAIWWHRYLPMQDFPQHLFMSVVAANYDDTAAQWSENFELRSQWGPYRISFLILKALLHVVDPLTAARILATLYVLLVGLAAYLVARQSDQQAPCWGALLFFPFCFHPMYFYGFINFIISIPILIISLLQLNSVLVAELDRKKVAVNFVLQLTLFVLHHSYQQQRDPEQSEQKDGRLGRAHSRKIYS